MSFLSETYLQDLRTRYPNPFDRTEWRGPERGLLMAVDEMSAGPRTLITGEVERVMEQSEGRVIEVPVVNKGSVSVTNARTCTVAGTHNTSALLNITYKTVVADILMVPSQHAKNEVGYTDDLRKKFQLAKEAFQAEEEADILAQLETDKDTFYGSPLVGAGDKYELTGDALQVALADQEFFFGDVDAIMRRDDFNEGQFIVGSTELSPYVRKYIAQADSNDENLRYQFSNKVFTFTNGIDNGATIRATGFVIPEGYIGLHRRVAIDSRMGHKATDGTEWGTMGLGMASDIGYKFQSKCDDQSALNAAGLAHLSATMVEHWQLSYDYAIVTEYNSDSAAKAGGLKKFEFLNA